MQCGKALNIVEQNTRQFLFWNADGQLDMYIYLKSEWDNEQDEDVLII